jgi:hypothetical protein
MTPRRTSRGVSLRAAAGRRLSPASAQGFASITKNLRLNVGAALDMPIRLNIEQSEHRRVVSVPVVETARTQVAASITPEEVQDLPLNGRNYLDLALLAPGASRTNTGVNQRFAETSTVPGTASPSPRSATWRTRSSSTVSPRMTTPRTSRDVLQPGSDPRIRRRPRRRHGGIRARLGGIINVVTHAGSNDARGGAYAFFRNDQFDAENALPAPSSRSIRSSTAPLSAERCATARFFRQRRTTPAERQQRVTILPANVTAINARLDATGYAGRASAAARPTTPSIRRTSSCAAITPSRRPTSSRCASTATTSTGRTRGSPAA